MGASVRSTASFAGVWSDDQAQPRWQADVTARRLGVEPLTIDASHSPFLSRPAELAELLVHAPTTTPTGTLDPG